LFADRLPGDAEATGTGPDTQRGRGRPGGIDARGVSTGARPEPGAFETAIAGARPGEPRPHRRRCGKTGELGGRARVRTRRLQADHVGNHQLLSTGKVMPGFAPAYAKSLVMDRSQGRNQVSHHARHAVVHGFPPRSRRQGTPSALRPFNVSEATFAGKNVV